MDNLCPLYVKKFEDVVFEFYEHKICIVTVNGNNFPYDKIKKFVSENNEYNSFSRMIRLNNWISNKKMGVFFNSPYTRKIMILVKYENEEFLLPPLSVDELSICCPDSVVCKPQGNIVCRVMRLDGINLTASVLKHTKTQYLEELECTDYPMIEKSDNVRTLKVRRYEPGEPVEKYTVYPNLRNLSLYFHMENRGFFEAVIANAKKLVSVSVCSRGHFDYITKYLAANTRIKSLKLYSLDKHQYADFEGFVGLENVKLVRMYYDPKEVIDGVQTLYLERCRILNPTTHKYVEEKDAKEIKACNPGIIKLTIETKTEVYNL